MDHLINLNPWLLAQRIAEVLLRRCGIEYFTLPEPEGLSFRLDSDKLERIVQLASKDAFQRAGWLPIDSRDLARCRRLLRRLLIRHLALGMLEAGY